MSSVMHEVVSVSGLFLAFSVTEKWVNGMEQMCVKVCDCVTRGDNESENCRVGMTKHDTQPQTNTSGRYYSTLLTSLSRESNSAQDPAKEGELSCVCSSSAETQLHWSTFRMYLGWAGSWDCPAPACGWWPNCCTGSWRVLLWSCVNTGCSRGICCW